MRHFNIFRRVAYVNAIAGFHAHAFHRLPQRGPVRFPMSRILGANAGIEKFREAKFFELPANSFPVAAGDKAEQIETAELSQQSPNAR